MKGKVTSRPTNSKRLIPSRVFLFGVLVALPLIFLSLTGAAPPPSNDTRTNSSAREPQTQKSQGKSSNDVWTAADQAAVASARQTRPDIRSYRTVSLNRPALATILQSAPMEFSDAATEKRSVLTLPEPDGTFARFSIAESPIMAPELAARFPEIKTYIGSGLDDPTATTRFDWTPLGFHAIVLSEKGTILIEPNGPGDVENYISYFQKDVVGGSGECDVTEQDQEAAIARYPKYSQATPAALSGTTLRTYRLAAAATAEYTQAYGGGTVQGGLSAITTTVNLVDAIYEREVAVRLTLIAGEASIIFTDTTTDGYTTDNVNLLIGENQNTLTSVIGAANYDIGHVFDGRLLGGSAFSWQGLATIGGVCVDSVKARGADIFRSVSPTSVFAYYSAAHEMGHQFGATHTFNATSGTCGAARTASTAYEPVNGSTIMAYRFACAPEDMMSMDTYFHSASIEQIVNFTTGVTGNSCAARSATGNNPPVVNAGPAFTIPMGTPFVLTATGSDPDGDALTFGWEEFDLGTAAPPSTDDGTRPIFRSFLPTSSPARTFPRLSDVLSGFQTLGESLPTTTRTMNFRVTARDNRTGGGGVNFAATQVNVRADSGPFTVTQPTSSNTWPTGSTQTVTWNVANTSVAPVSCANVKITLSTDGGTTFPIILANNTPNDGSETVTIPGTPASGARVKVEAVGNIFFNLSQGFTVSGSANTTPTITGFTPASGPVGSSVTINGTNFISPSAVQFSGVNASFTVNSTTQIAATVPSGAASGPITVTTSSGTATSPTNFIVTAPVIVSGQVKDGSNNPVSGVLITFDMDRLGTPSTTSTTTDASGNYASADLGCQNRITVTPSKGALSFSPTSISFVSSSQCLSGPSTANFTASAPVNTIQFSAPNYPVSEATPDAIVMVTRTGNTSAAATVGYATSDTSGANNCNVVNGAASSRCDYLTTLGTLQFSANETSRTISIPIVDDSWKDDTETFTITLSNPTGATLGTQASATVTITDNDPVNGTNPIDGSSFFVRQHYIDFLNREPDASGLNFWINNIDGCSPKPSCTEIQRINTSAAFFLSIEFQDTGYFVYRAYKAAYGDATGTSTTGGVHNLSVPIIRLIEFLPDTQRIGQGVIVGQGNWQQQIDANKTAFTEEFVQRTRFLTAYPLSMTPAQFVDGLNTQAATGGVKPLTQAQRDQLVSDLTNGIKTRGAVLRAVAENQTLSSAEFNRAFVLMQFFGYLRRNPNDPQDTDYAGYEFWLGKLNQFNGNFVNAEMVKAFITSSEYRQRFGP